MSRVALGERCPERGCPGSPQVREAATQLLRGQDVDTRCSERGCPSRRLRMTYTHGRCAPYASRSLFIVRSVEHLDVNNSPLDTPPEGALQAAGVCCGQIAYARRCVLSWHLSSHLFSWSRGHDRRDRRGAGPCSFNGEFPMWSRVRVLQRVHWMQSA